MELKSEAHDDTVEPATDNLLWVEQLSSWLDKTHPGCHLTRARTMLSCDVKSRRGALFVPPDMAELQPKSLEYLHCFADNNSLVLIEDRRRFQIKPLLERRQQATPMIAKAVSELLTAAGLPGEPPSLSYPHRLNDDSPFIAMTELLHMAAFVTPDSKRVQLPANSKLVNVLNNDARPVSAYACQVKTAETSTILSFFDAPEFRAIGYSAGRQYVVHVCLAGGPMSQPLLWTGVHTLTRTDFQFQLIPSPRESDSLGLFYTTFYFQMGHQQSPWWLESSSLPTLLPNNVAHQYEERKAG